MSYERVMKFLRCVYGMENAQKPASAHFFACGNYEHCKSPTANHGRASHFHEGAAHFSSSAARTSASERYVLPQGAM